MTTRRHRGRRRRQKVRRWMTRGRLRPPARDAGRAGLASCGVLTVAANAIIDTGNGCLSSAGRLSAGAEPLSRQLAAGLSSEAEIVDYAHHLGGLKWCLVIWPEKNAAAAFRYFGSRPEAEDAGRRLSHQRWSVVDRYVSAPPRDEALSDMQILRQREAREVTAGLGPRLRKARYSGADLARYPPR